MNRDLEDDPGLVDPENRLHHDQVPGARYRQEFRRPLNDPEDDCFPERHVLARL